MCKIFFFYAYKDIIIGMLPQYKRNQAHRDDSAIVKRYIFFKTTCSVRLSSVFSKRGSQTELLLRLVNHIHIDGAYLHGTLLLSHVES